MTPPAEDALVTGRCYCGGVTFEVRLPAGEAPLFTAYCHCDSCRRAHAAPLYHVACVDARWHSITAGAALLNEFQKREGGIVRAFCGGCGSRVLNRFPGWRPGGREPLAFFPDLLDDACRRPLPEALRPRKNNQPQECVLDVEALRWALEPAPA